MGEKGGWAGFQQTEFVAVFYPGIEFQRNSPAVTYRRGEGIVFDKFTSELNRAAKKRKKKSSLMSPRYRLVTRPAFERNVRKLLIEWLR